MLASYLLVNVRLFLIVIDVRRESGIKTKYFLMDFFVIFEALVFCCCSEDKIYYFISRYFFTLNIYVSTLFHAVICQFCLSIISSPHLQHLLS